MKEQYINFKYPALTLSFQNRKVKSKYRFCHQRYLVEVMLYCIFLFDAIYKAVFRETKVPFDIILCFDCALLSYDCLRMKEKKVFDVSASFLHAYAINKKKLLYEFFQQKHGIKVFNLNFQHIHIKLKQHLDYFCLRFKKKFHKHETIVRSYRINRLLKLRNSYKFNLYC